MKTSEILNKAADLIAEHGLGKGEFRQPDGSHCAVGAIKEASGFGPHGAGFSPDALAAVRVLAKRLDYNLDHPDYGDVHEAALATIGIDWNDDNDRTAEQVIAELRAAAASEREAGR